MTAQIILSLYPGPDAEGTTLELVHAPSANDCRAAVARVSGQAAGHFEIILRDGPSLYGLTFICHQVTSAASGYRDIMSYREPGACRVEGTIPQIYSPIELYFDETGRLTRVATRAMLQPAARQ